MCGINGLISSENWNGQTISEKLDKMNQEIFHRGPDQGGTFIAEENFFSLGMGMRRLSIIDLATGEQPMTSTDKKINLVFNGEIYNYKDLKNDLIKKGCTFLTNSDTEVILKLYENYGVESFAMLDGMFAFCIYDHKKKKIFIARDFFGEKPLYYTQTNGTFFWASELKSIIRNLDKKPPISPAGLNLFFQLTYIPAPFTIYEEIFKLEANHYLEYNCINFSYTINRIEQTFSEQMEPSVTFSKAKQKTHDLIHKSVESRSVSDVSLGTFLSGGVDSSIVSLCLAQQTSTKIDTFSIGFDKKSFDETDKSRTVAKLINSNHHEFILTEADLRQNAHTILNNFDEPFADSSSLPSFVVAQKARQKVKVALTGDGGDEVFGGYNKYYMGKLNRHYTSAIPKAVNEVLLKTTLPFLATKHDKRGIRFKAKRLLKAINYEGDFYYNILSLGFPYTELNSIFKKKFVLPNVLNYYRERIGNEDGSIHNFRSIDQLISLEGDMLVKVDRTSMLTSLESRAPFLNKELWNFTSQLPEDYLMRGWNKKYLLKQAFNNYFPKGFLEKSKRGFEVPVGDWLRGYFKNELLSYIDKKFLERQEIFDARQIEGIVKNHLSGREDNTFRVWTYFCFQKWYKLVHLSS